MTNTNHPLYFIGKNEERNTGRRTFIGGKNGIFAPFRLW
jgi:hypothetical protein